MAITDKLIVTVAPTSNFQGKEANPALPYSPQEAADAIYECWNEGASVVHIHGRDKNGLPTNDPSFFLEVDHLIREKGCDIIIQHSMAMANPALLGQDVGQIDEGLKSMRITPPPEMVSLEVAPSNIVLKDGKVIPTPWDRIWARNVASELLEKGIKPEIEIYNNSDLDDVKFLISEGVLTKPYYVSFVMDMHRVNNQAASYSPKYLMLLIDSLPPDSLFSTMCIGANEFRATTMSILLGGNVRVGFEDNIYIEKGKLAESNAQLVKHIVGIAKALGRQIASPDEAREMLGIPLLEK